MRNDRRAIAQNNMVSEVIACNLDGYTQKILIDGKSKTSPVVIFLHGGPGFPAPLNVACRGMFPELTDHVIMVYWDQLGCGINNYNINNSFTISMYTKMVVDLIKVVKNMFPNNPLYVFGASWGSILAATASVEVSEIISGVYTYGQVLKKLGFSENLFNELRKNALPSHVKKELSEIVKKPYHTLNDYRKMSRWIMRYTEGYKPKKGGKPPLGRITRAILTSKDYGIKDVIATFFNGCTFNKSLTRQMIDIDLSDSITTSSVPYNIIQGEKDLVTPTEDIVELCQNCANKNLKLEIIKGHSHSATMAVLTKVINSIAKQPINKKERQ